MSCAGHMNFSDKKLTVTVKLLHFQNCYIFKIEVNGFCILKFESKCYDDCNLEGIFVINPRNIPTQVTSFSLFLLQKKNFFLTSEFYGNLVTWLQILCLVAKKTMEVNHQDDYAIKIVLIIDP